MEEIFRESFERSRKHEKMFDSSWDNGTNHLRSREVLMDLDDLDLDASWPLDQTPFMSDPIMSPFVVSSSEQPCSPLWEFSGAGGAAAEDEKLAPALRYPEYPLFLTCASRSVAENMAESDNIDSYWLIKERMTQALRSFKESTGEHVLAQVWAPVRKGGRYVLTTLGQPFVLDPHSNGLNQYRMVSLAYMFSVDSESDYELGLPGRVFRQKLPEWTPNVQYYSSKEFSRLDHALLYNVRGTLALPVFGPSGKSCIAVVELIMTSEKIHYAPDVDKVCRALEAVDLKSSEILDHQTTTQICNESRQNALAEILEILTVVCETHKLPLAQTWVPCMHRSVLAYGGGLRKSCTSFDGSCMGKVCMSTTDVASYVVDAHVWGFRDACLEHHLQKGQGVAGRAFLNRNSCFCRDITRFSKTEYPLVHYARMFKLTGCFAICLQSSYTDADDYVLEFFLPSTVTDRSQQNSLLGSLLASIKQHLQSLRVASGLELGVNEVSVEIFEASEDKDIDWRIESFQIPDCVKSPPRPNSSPNAVGLQPNSPEKQLMLEPDIKEQTNCGNIVGQNNASACLTEVKEVKKSEKKRGKTEKTISMEVLQQYFAGSLKDAAKSLGVCPTTMKRICRQHGIARWPSRKINKVNRSLTKLKRVIESVRVGDGAIDLTSLTSSPLPVAVGSISWSANPNGIHQLSSPNGLKSQGPLLPLDNSQDGGSPATNPTTGVDEQSMCGDLFSQEHIDHQNVLAEISSNNESTRSKTGSGSKEESAASPASYNSCEAKPPKEANVSVQEGGFMIDGSHDLTIRHPLLAAATEDQELIVLEDARLSKDLGHLSPMMFQVKYPESSWVNPISNNNAGVPPKDFMDVTQSMPRVPSKPEMKSITIKANYRDDIVRFRVSPSSGIMELKEEVAKRLKLEVGTFDIKYLDDDQEWVLIACDADLQECLDISISAGSSVARLSVHDVMANLGSSCESTGELC